MTTTTKRTLTRRQFIPRALGSIGAALGIGGVAGYELRGSGGGAAAEAVGPTATTIPTAGNPGSGVQTFVSRPDLHPPLVRITDLHNLPEHPNAPQYIVMAPMADVPYRDLQRGPMMVDHQGRLVWYAPHADATFDVQVQSYKGKPVITRWHGQLVGGYGEGVGEIIDQSYRTVAVVGHPTKRPIDLHEFNVTDRGTALATYYETRPWDLSPIGGDANGVLLIGHALEIDIETNKTLLDWVTIDHVGIDESYQPLPGSASTAFDYFHINSVSEAADGNLLISGRNTWAIYKVNRNTGEIMWRLNGKRSDFKVPNEAGFSWQHHVRAHGKHDLTIFDNAIISGHASQAMIVTLDEAKREIRLKRALQHPAKFVSWTLGSVQIRPDGRIFVGWGAQPYFSEFSHEGQLLVDGQFDSATRSYRTFLVEWEGQPTDQPTMVARSNEGAGFVIYASWNGATEIDHWDVLAGSDPASLQQVGSQQWTGFETTIIVNSDGPLFQVAAIGRAGKELGRSKVV